MSRKADHYEAEYFENIYGVVNKERESILNWDFDYLKSQKKEITRILDVGCALGEFLAICDRDGLETFGVEISNYAISKAAKKTKAKIFKLDAGHKKIPFANGFFDAVCAFDFLEHVKNSSLVFAEVYRVLKKGGIFLATTPNGSVLFKNFLPYDPTHINIKSSNFWEKSFKKTGFADFTSRGCLAFGFPPSPSVRLKIKKVGLPVIVRPLFFPIKGFCGTLFLQGFK